MPAAIDHRRCRRFTLAALFLGCVVCALADRAALDLSGTWQAQLAQGAAQDTWDPEAPRLSARLPGSLAENRIGWDVGLDTPWMGRLNSRDWWTADKYAPYRQPGNLKIPFWLQPIKYYRGRAWYRREVAIPRSWQDKRIILVLERPHWQTCVWVDDRPAGPPQDSLATPHGYDLSSLLPPGRHALTIRVDNDYLVDVGVDAHSVTDHTQTNWNGIVGRIQLLATDKVWIDRVEVYSDAAHRSARVRAFIGNDTGRRLEGVLTCDVKEARGRQRLAESRYTCAADPAGTTVEFELALPATAPLWDEFHPNLLRAELTLASDRRQDRASVEFGLRDFRASKSGFTVNGRPAFMRGTLECCIFPRTGYPAMDEAAWRRIYRIARAHGLNHMRFHSWCPPEAAFAAADAEGMYLQVECGVWRGNGDPRARPVEAWLYDETERILREYGNHPSFVFLVHGNEPWQLMKSEGGRYLNRWVAHFKARDPRHLVGAGANLPLIPENDYENAGPMARLPLRYHGEFERRPPTTTRDYAALIDKLYAPVIAHEVGEWCVFPNLDEIGKYTGVLKANNYEIVRDCMQAHHLLPRAHDFLVASGKFQAALYKEEIEAFLRTPGMGGFQLLDLHDFPGQGTALVGVLDAFWEEKGYITPEEFRRFSGPVVPLAVMQKRVWSGEETFRAQLRIAQFSEGPLENARPEWNVRDDRGRVLAAGRWEARTIPVGNDCALGQVEFRLVGIARASRLTLEVRLPGTPWRNDWSFWVYPAAPETPEGDVLVCSELNAATTALAAGRRVLWLLDPGLVAGNTAGTFEPIFWNKAWFPSQKPHTLGLLIDAGHPALADFPTDAHADWQWWDPMKRGRPMILDAFPSQLSPIVQPIDDWNQCRRLGLVCEAKVGPGRLMICSIDLKSELDARPVARQLRRSLLAYMNSADFRPQIELDASILSRLVVDSALGRMKAQVSADSAQPGYGPRLAIDGDLITMWHSAWEPDAAPYPHQLVVDMQAPRRVRAIRLLPRQDGNRNGWVRGVEICLSADGKTWGDSAVRAQLSNDVSWKRLALPAAMTARYLRLVFFSPQNPDDPWASLAELDVED